jgi:hypothetical protein
MQLYTGVYTGKEGRQGLATGTGNRRPQAGELTFGIVPKEQRKETRGP